MRQFISNLFREMVEAGYIISGGVVILVSGLGLTGGGTGTKIISGVALGYLILSIIHKRIQDKDKNVRIAKLTNLLNNGPKLTFNGRKGRFTIELTPRSYMSLGQFKLVKQFEAFLQPFAPGVTVILDPKEREIDIIAPPAPVEPPPTPVTTPTSAT